MLFSHVPGKPLDKAVRLQAMSDTPAGAGSQTGFLAQCTKHDCLQRSSLPSDPVSNLPSGAWVSRSRCRCCANPAQVDCDNICFDSLSVDLLPNDPKLEQPPSTMIGQMPLGPLCVWDQETNEPAKLFQNPLPIYPSHFGDSNCSAPSY